MEDLKEKLKGIIENIPVGKNRMITTKIKEIIILNNGYLAFTEDKIRERSNYQQIRDTSIYAYEFRSDYSIRIRIIKTPIFQTYEEFVVDTKQMYKNDRKKEETNGE